MSADEPTAPPGDEATAEERVAAMERAAVAPAERTAAAPDDGPGDEVLASGPGEGTPESLSVDQDAARGVFQRAAVEDAPPSRDVAPATIEATAERRPVPPALEELVEPLDALPAPHQAGDVVPGPDGLAFRIVAPLDQAGTSHYVAVVEGTDDQVLLRQAVNPEGRDALGREAALLGEVDSPFLPRLRSSFEGSGRTYLATDLPPERTLAEELAPGCVSLARKLSLLSQVAAAVGAMHRQGWVHQGLTPAAIGMGRPIRLLNLGYVLRVGEAPALARSLAGYSAPEVPQRQPADPRSDVYSLGAILYQCVTGSPVGEAGPELRAWTPPPSAAGVPQILQRCLGEPAERYPSARELHADLLRLARRLAPQPVYAIGTTTSIGLDPQRRTNQDAYLTLTGTLQAEEGARRWALLAVADGMGGMAAGDVAARAAVDTVAREAASALAADAPADAPQQAAWVTTWVQQANSRVCAALDKLDARGGCTLVVACLIGQRLAIAHVGDCRLYHWHDEQLDLLTRDHSLAMAHVLQGELPLEQLRHHPDRSKVTRALGERQPLPAYAIDSLEQATGQLTIELAAGSALLLCCDGLWEPVLEDDMRRVLGERPDPAAAATALVRLALERGGHDNATAVVLRVRQQPGILED